MQQRRIETHGRWSAALVTAASVAVAVLAGASCSRSHSSAAGPSPYQTTVHTLAPSPTDQTGNATELPNIYFVIGNKGINGTADIQVGTKVISLTNNDDKTHQLDLLRIPSTETAEEIAKAANAGAKDPNWTAKAGHVVVHGPVQGGQVTKSMHVTGLKAGTYALVDVAPGPHGGKPYAADTAFVWLVQMTPPPA